MALRRLTRGERLACKARNLLGRVTWLWRRPKGCVCDPDGYPWNDHIPPPCEAHDFNAPRYKGYDVTDLVPFLAPWDTCSRCGHDAGCLPVPRRSPGERP